MTKPRRGFPPCVFLPLDRPQFSQSNHMGKRKLHEPCLVLSFHYCSRCAASGGRRYECSASKLFNKLLACEFRIFCGDWPFSLPACSRSCPVRCQHLNAMPWWAPLGGLAGAVAVFAGLTLIDKLGAGTVNGLIIAANIVTSISIDHFGLRNTPVHTGVRPFIPRLHGKVVVLVLL